MYLYTFRNIERVVVVEAAAAAAAASTEKLIVRQPWGHTLHSLPYNVF